MVQALKIAAGAVLHFFLLATAHAQNIPTCTLTVQPSEVLGSGRVMLTWSTTHATTCVASGAWSGVKDCAGGTQGADVNSTRTFTLTVKAATGKVTARWTKPTTNTDNSPATITGYKLYVADSAAQLPAATPIDLPASPLEYVFWRAPGDVRSGIKAVRSDGVDSAMSNIAGKTVLAASGKCSATVTVSPRPKAPALTISWLKELLGIDQDDANRTNGG